jgi:hypothetical protein
LRSHKRRSGGSNVTSAEPHGVTKAGLFWREPFAFFKGNRHMASRRISEFMRPTYLALREIFRPVPPRTPANHDRRPQTQDFGGTLLHADSIVDEQLFCTVLSRRVSLDNGDFAEKTVLPQCLSPKKSMTVIAKILPLLLAISSSIFRNLAGQPALQRDLNVAFLTIDQCFHVLIN